MGIGISRYKNPILDQSVFHGMSFQGFVHVAHLDYLFIQFILILALVNQSVFREHLPTTVRIVFANNNNQNNRA